MTALRLARHRLHSRTLAILQTAVAALVAWYLCVLLLPDPRPVFACIATVVAIGASHGAHRQRALSLIGGVVLGLAIADLLVHLIGTGAPQLVLLVILAMSAAVLLNGSEIVVSEAAVSAMLLVLAGPGTGANRIFEAIIGGAVALVVVLLFPHNPVVHVGRAAQAVFAQLGQALERIAAALEAGDADKASAALVQAREIDALLDPLEDALASGRETARTAPTRFGAREPVERYARSLEQIDLAVRNTRVLARHAMRAIRTDVEASVLSPAVTDLAGAVWDLAAAYDDPERAWDAWELASRAAARTQVGALSESIRSNAVDLMRAAELVAGAPDEQPTEELLLLAPVGDDADVDVGERPENPHDERLREAAEAAARRGRPEQDVGDAALAHDPFEDCHFVATVHDEQVGAEVRDEPAQRLEALAFCR
jgi:uncharacterized membrane protein YgaE (UPF0421/DUF939 family)